MEVCYHTLAREGKEDSVSLCSSRWDCRGAVFSLWKWYNVYMTTISVHEMQRDPLGCLRRVEAGETLVVVRDEQAVAEIKPMPIQADQPRPFGLCAGEFTVPTDFDESLPESILKEFEGQ
jgi:antitoxin (DNA-binding transcriptional repressor) of toxin-antitoxin stability system